MRKKIVLIDGHSILNRAFYGVPDLTTPEGLHTNAVYGFLNIMFKILDEEKPEYLTVTFDVHAPTFRHEMFSEYKGTRKPMAEELRQQVPVIKEVLEAMNISTIEKAGLEADDLLGTLSRMCEESGMDVSIISGDRDTLQLATEHVKIRIPKTKQGKTEIENYYAADVVERYKVTPREFIDVKALMGDSADNIPGVPGIGEKTATKIIMEYQTIENAYAHASRFFSPGHFSLIVIDEAHRSIFNKYKAIFQYFDACLLGLTATPKNTIHQSTYTFFDMKNNIPTDVYEYEEAVEKDHVLVPFYLIETSTQISDDGITYADLDEEEREAYEAEFVEDGGVPEHIPPERINKYIFNVDTVDRMISDLMNNGIRHKNGNHVGKTIIFAQNKLHAKFIVDRFNELYPQYKGNFCKLVVCDEPYAGQNLKDFKKADDYPFITVTVDMLETGVSQTKGY